MKHSRTLPLFVLVMASVLSAAGPESDYKARRTVSGHPDGCHEGNYSLRNVLSGARKAEEAGK